MVLSIARSCLTPSPCHHRQEQGCITRTLDSPQKRWNCAVVNRGQLCRNQTICSSNRVLCIVNDSRNKNKSKNVLTAKCNGCASIHCEDVDGWSNFKKGVVEQLTSFIHFSRPHTVIGTVIGITSVSLLPVQTVSDLSSSYFIGLLKALVPAVLMNIYVVGLNQLFDIEIDKVNKPHLPLASGNFSMGTGIAIVSASLFMSLGMGIMLQSPPLLSALLISFVLGSVYSVELPLLRWKKQAFLAASCILIVRAIVVQLAFFVHMQKFVLGRPIVITKPLVFAVGFMCFFSAVIALFKDIPDVDGDRDFGVQSFSVTLGQERVFWLCVNMLLMAYGASIAVGAYSSFLPNKLVTVLGHSTLALLLWVRARSVDLTSKASITSFYMFIWKLFYAEYFLVPFVR